MPYHSVENPKEPTLARVFALWQGLKAFPDIHDSMVTHDGLPYHEWSIRTNVVHTVKSRPGHDICSHKTRSIEDRTKTAAFFMHLGHQIPAALHMDAVWGRLNVPAVQRCIFCSLLWLFLVARHPH